jgi:hypothetical protein
VKQMVLVFCSALALFIAPPKHATLRARERKAGWRAASVKNFSVTTAAPAPPSAPAAGRLQTMKAPLTVADKREVPQSGADIVFSNLSKE